MRYHLILILLLLNSINLFAKDERRDVYRVYQVDPDTDLDSLNSRINNLKDIRPSQRIFSRTQRDQIIAKYLVDKADNLDELERDLIFKSLIHYTQEQFFTKYPDLIKQDTYLKMKDELEGL